jgi:hypothetical protein
VRVVGVNVRQVADGTRIAAAISTESNRNAIEAFVQYRADASYVDGAADAFAAATLLPAMRATEPLGVESPIAPRLAMMLPRIRDVFHTWWPHLARIDIDVSPARRASAAMDARGAATYFSGGVDSFYTLLKHRGGHGSLPVPLSHVIFMRGVETRLEDIKGVEETERWIREVAAHAGVAPILGETNFRTALQGPEENLHWEAHYHGSALGAIALPLSGRLAFVCIPSAFSYNHLVAHGSTPLVDEMFSTERLQILHDGAEATRATKVGRIIEWDRDLVLRHLRVCIENRGGASNCGRCKKCVRTAVPLRVLGVWERARTFPDKDTAHWEDVMLGDHLVLTEENLRFAEAHNADRRLIALLRRVSGRKRRRDTAKALLARPPLKRFEPAVYRMRDEWWRIRSRMSRRS